MSATLQIVSSATDLTEGMKREIADQLARLERCAGGNRLHNCRVVISRPASHPGMAQMFNVRLRVTMDDCELAANLHEHPDFHVALHRAFDSMRRQVSSQRGIRAPAAARAHQAHRADPAALH
jgi:ribosome-associated translation inhibitor RaiA